MMKNYKIIVLGIATLSIMLWTIARPYYIAGDCMEPAVKNGQLCLVNQIAPFLRQHRIHDIVTFNYEGKAWIARVVALENDTIQIISGNIILNGVVASSTGIKRNWSDWKYGSYAIDEPLRVPSGHVFVLSDDLAAHHDDSRVFGPIPKSHISGLVWVY